MMPRRGRPTLFSSLARKVLWRLGYQISRRPLAGTASPGGPHRPVGVMLAGGGGSIVNIASVHES